MSVVCGPCQCRGPSGGVRRRRRMIGAAPGSDARRSPRPIRALGDWACVRLGAGPE